MKKLIVLLLSTPLLYGCAYIGSKVPENPPTPHQQLCMELSRDITFNTTTVPSTGHASATQQAELMNLYKENGCDKLEK